MNFPQAIVIPAVKKHTATIICVHGLGDTGAGWTFLAENWRRRGKFEDTKFIFPSASRIPITSVIKLDLHHEMEINTLF
jgi:predicted esterase